MIEFHHQRVPTPAAIRTRLVLRRQDQGPDLRLPPQPLFPPLLLVGVVVGTLVGAFLLSRRHGFLPQGRAGEGNRTPMTSLEGWSFTIKLHPQSPMPVSMGRAGFEPA